MKWEASLFIVFFPLPASRLKVCIAISGRDRLNGTKNITADIVSQRYIETYFTPFHHSSNTCLSSCKSTNWPIIGVASGMSAIAFILRKGSSQG